MNQRQMDDFSDLLGDLQDDAVVAGLDVAVGDPDVRAAVGIDPVGVGPVILVVEAVHDRDAANGHAIAVDRADGPPGAVAERDVLEQQVLAVASGKFSWARNCRNCGGLNSC